MELCFHLEDHVGFESSDVSLKLKKFSDYGINRFSKLNYHNDHTSHDKNDPSQYKDAHTFMI